MWGWLSRLFSRAPPAVLDHSNPHFDPRPSLPRDAMDRTEAAPDGNPLPPQLIAAPPLKPTIEGPLAFVIDVETTGLAPYDRIVTLAAIKLIGLDMPPDGHFYLVFDPRKDNHPEAVTIHGWDDWTLRSQALFAATAIELHQVFSAASLLICHNTEFDMSMLQHEFRKAGLPPLTTKTFCTLTMARERWPGQRATLDACLSRIGLARTGQRHSAFEDAFLAMNLYRFYGGAERPYRMSTYPAPTNYCAPPPRPLGKLPRRTKKTWRPREP